GVDGVLVLGCKHGDDYQCHNIKGSELAQERISKVEETLSRIQLESERVQFQNISISEHRKLPEVINEFMEMIKRVGPNPFKEFADFS
ncbi:MAG: hydrogenase iron-sulfur subunit, partial [Nitrospinota bacterium]|nr:hydrogenase iron-sulfur subunit [Nitrospinota bacterium]